MKVVISSFGSSGDFNPCLGLGRALQKRGVEVLFLSNPYYQKKIIDAGLRFFPAGQYWDVFKEIEENPGFLHPQIGPRMVWKLVLKTLPVMYSAMSELVVQEKPDVIACHILEFGGMLASLQRQIPYATLNPTPMGWFSVAQPGHFIYSTLPSSLRRVQAHMIRLLVKIAHRYWMQPYCRKKQIPNPLSCIEDVYGNARINLGFWSCLFRAKASDDPPHSKICGFVRDEHIKDWPDVPEAVRNLFTLEKKPVVVGMGSTASLHAEMIYQNVSKACQIHDWPCLLIGKNVLKYADPKRSVIAVDFAPYGWVFPQAGVVIHHGGLNTTAEVLRAGVPSMVIPHAYDQFDNAIRIETMGVSKRLKLSQVPSKYFTNLLKNILNDTEMLNRAKLLSKQIQAEPDGAECAAEEILKEIV